MVTYTADCTFEMARVLAILSCNLLRHLASGDHNLHQGIPLARSLFTGIFHAFTMKDDFFIDFDKVYELHPCFGGNHARRLFQIISYANLARLAAMLFGTVAIHEDFEDIQVEKVMEAVIDFSDFPVSFTDQQDWPLEDDGIHTSELYIAFKFQEFIAAISCCDSLEGILHAFNERFIRSDSRALILRQTDIRIDLVEIPYVSDFGSYADGFRQEVENIYKDHLLDATGESHTSVRIALRNRYPQRPVFEMLRTWTRSIAQRTDIFSDGDVNFGDQTSNQWGSNDLPLWKSPKYHCASEEWFSCKSVNSGGRGGTSCSGGSVAGYAKAFIVLVKAVTANKPKG